MVLSETVQFVVIFGITIVFSAFAIAIKEKPWSLILKVTAGLSWFIMALSTFMFFGVTAILAIPMMFLFFGIGAVFCFTIVMDFNEEKKQRIWGFQD